MIKKKESTFLGNKVYFEYFYCHTVTELPNLMDHGLRNIAKGEHNASVFLNKSRHCGLYQTAGFLCLHPCQEYYVLSLVRISEE